MATDPTSRDERDAAQKARRKPLTIDLPAAEVARKAAEAEKRNETEKPGEAKAASGASSSAAARSSDAGKIAKPVGSTTDGAATSASRESRPADPVIPSAFATPKADAGASAKARGTSSSEASHAGKSSRSALALFLAALAGGALVAAVIVVLALSGHLAPAKDTSGAGVAADVAALKNEIAALKQTGADLAPLKDQVAALQKSVGDLASRPAAATVDPAALKDIETRLASLESATPIAGPAPDDVGPRIAALEQDVAALKSAAPPDTVSLQAALEKLRRDVDALSTRVDAAPTDERIAAIEAKLDQTSQQIESAAALAPAVAAEALAAALDSGRPFQAELAALKSLGADPQAIDTLSADASTGLPTHAQLSAEFDAAIRSVALSSPVPESAGTLDRLLQSARGLVEVRPAHPTAGSDPGAIVARIRGALGSGDLKTALAEWDTLPETIKAPTAEWANKARARLEADDLVAKVQSAALSHLGAGN